MQMILISGQAGVGKTTLAEIIAEEAFSLGLTPVMLPFAGPIKDLAKEKGFAKDVNPEKYREFCQNYGSTVRDGDPDHFVSLFTKRVEEIKLLEAKDINDKKTFWERVVISDDCRYVNELVTGLAYNAVTIFLSSGKRRLSKEDWRKHESEDLAKGVESNSGDYKEMFRHLLLNDSTTKAFKKKVKKMVPIWCGIMVKKMTEDCNCEACTARREGRLPEIEEVISELIDLLMFGELDDEEDEEDKETT